MGKFKDLKGLKFGKLTVIEQALDFMRVIDDMQDVEVEDHLGNLSND
jgi:hypothetical protein